MPNTTTPRTPPRPLEDYKKTEVTQKAKEFFQGVIKHNGGNTLETRLEKLAEFIDESPDLTEFLLQMDKSTQQKKNVDNAETPTKQEPLYKVTTLDQVLPLFELLDQQTSDVDAQKDKLKTVIDFIFASPELRKDLNVLLQVELQAAVHQNADAKKIQKSNFQVHRLDQFFKQVGKNAATNEAKKELVVHFTVRLLQHADEFGINISADAIHLMAKANPDNLNNAKGIIANDHAWSLMEFVKVVLRLFGVEYSEDLLADIEKTIKTLPAITTKVNSTSTTTTTEKQKQVKDTTAENVVSENEEDDSLSLEDEQIDDIDPSITQDSDKKEKRSVIRNLEADFNQHEQKIEEKEAEKKEQQLNGEKSDNDTSVDLNNVVDSNESTENESTEEEKSTNSTNDNEKETVPDKFKKEFPHLLTPLSKSELNQRPATGVKSQPKTNSRHQRHPSDTHGLNEKIKDDLTYGANALSTALIARKLQFTEDDNGTGFDDIANLDSSNSDTETGFQGIEDFDNDSGNSSNTETGFADIADFDDNDLGTGFPPIDDFYNNSGGYSCDNGSLEGSFTIYTTYSSGDLNPGTLFSNSPYKSPMKNRVEVLNDSYVEDKENKDAGNNSTSLTNGSDTVD